MSVWAPASALDFRTPKRPITAPVRPAPWRWTDMQQAVTARTPVHLWIVGVLSLLWNCFGAYDYLMSHMRNMDYLGSMGGDPNRMLAYMDGMQMYAKVGWGLGVWLALL